MNKIKRFAIYFIYILTVGYLIIKGNDFFRYLRDLYLTNYDPTYLWIWFSIFPILIGIFLALPYLLFIINKPGKLKFDWIKFLAVNIPALYVAITPIYILICLDSPEFVLKLSNYIFMFHERLILISGVVFGFVLLTSLYKKN